MWAENNTLPQACTGDTRAMNKANQPAAKAIASQRRIPLPVPDCRQSLLSPQMKSPAVATSEMTTTGSKLHARARSCQVCGLPSCAHVVTALLISNAIAMTGDRRHPANLSQRIAKEFIAGMDESQLQRCPGPSLP